MMQSRPYLAAGLLALLPALCAAADEPVVYADDLARAGETELGMIAWTGRGGGRPGRTTQLFGELAYGLSDRWEIALKAPFTRADGRWHADGLYAEAKYLAPPAGAGWYWGVALEAGRAGEAGAERDWTVELAPIAGYRAGRWHAVFNPGLEYEAEEGGARFSPKARLDWRLAERHTVGVEYHAEAGGRRLPSSRPGRMAYLTWDMHVGEHRFGVALGHAAAGASGRWALRLLGDLDL